jgi:chromosome segregation ATPase
MGEQNIDAEFESGKDDGDGSKEEISMLMERMNRLENTVSEITEQQTELTHEITKQSQRMNEMSDSVENLREAVDELEENSEIQESRMNNINRSLDALEEDLEGTKGEIKDRTEQLEKRLKGIENMMDIDQKDIAKAVKPDACELEQLTVIPESSRADQFTVRVQRAIALFENFHEISTPVKSGGERVLSKDIKTFLNGYSNNDIKYTQVQRVIDSFDEKTNEDYHIKNTNDGRAIIWAPEN